MVKELKVGIFVALGTSLLVAIILLLGDFRLVRRYKIYAAFDNISGVPLKSNVLLNGVKIGNVSGIALEENKVVVQIKIIAKYKLHKGAIAKVVSISMIGNKIIEIVDGPFSAAVLLEDALIEGKSALNYEKVIEDVSNRLSSFFGDGSEGVGGTLDKLAKVMNNLDSITGKIDRVLGAEGRELSSVLNDVKDTLSSIRELSDNLSGVVMDNKDGIKEIVRSINEAVKELKQITDNINNQKGIAGKLLGDEEMAADLKKTVQKVRSATEEAEKIIKKAGKVGTDWYYEAGAYGLGVRNSAGITLRPNEDKYYALRVENISSASQAKFDTEGQTYNSLTAVLGKKIKNVTLYGGAIRSSGGFGLSYSPMKNNMIDITGEAFMFDRVKDAARPVAGVKDGAWLNCGLKVRLTPWLAVKLVKEDILAGDERFSAGINLDIKDDDLAYLFGFGWLYSLGK